MKISGLSVPRWKQEPFWHLGAPGGASPPAPPRPGPAARLSTADSARPSALPRRGQRHGSGGSGESSSPARPQPGPQPPPRSPSVRKMSKPNPVTAPPPHIPSRWCCISRPDPAEPARQRLRLLGACADEGLLVLAPEATGGA